MSKGRCPNSKEANIIDDDVDDDDDNNNTNTVQDAFLARSLNSAATMATLNTIPVIRESFYYKPIDYSIPQRPTRVQVHSIRKKIISNLKTIYCSIPGSHGNFSFLVMSEDLLRERRLEDLGIDPDNYAAVQKTIDDGSLTNKPEELLPPKKMTVDPTWTPTQYLNALRVYDDAIIEYRYMTNIQQAILQDLSDAIPHAVIVDLRDADGSLANPHAILTILETRYACVTYDELEEIHEEFKKPFDDSMTIFQYFTRKEECISQLKDTIPLSVPYQIQICLAHFRQMPYLFEDCMDWYVVYPPSLDVEPTWIQFRTHFTNAFLREDSSEASIQDNDLIHRAMIGYPTLQDYHTPSSKKAVAPLPKNSNSPDSPLPLTPLYRA